MEFRKLQEEIKRDEGIVYRVYLDHLGYPTFGIGHLIRKSDPEHGQIVGTPVTEQRINEVFTEDLATVITDCKTLFPDFDSLPDMAQRVIANMMFNMGLTRLSKFRKFIAGVNARDWAKAADEMIDSKWHRQVPTRAKRLVVRIRALA